MKERKFREVLIFVAGTTPQIITETIYALIHQIKPTFPDEIFIITTTDGEKILQKKLLQSGVFFDFCKEFDLKQDMLLKDSLIVLKDASGKPLQDIRNKQDNEALGNYIVEFIREKASDQGVRLHCSLAGGRKTMSFCLGSALQLFGRPWDKLYHILVTPEFESSTHFYYKPRKDKIIRHNGKDIHTKDAEIFLVELPFIRLKDKIAFESKSFAALVKEGQKEVDTALTQPPIIVNLKEGIVGIGNKSVEFKPFHVVFYAYFLRQKLERCPYPEKLYCLDCTDCYMQISELITPGIAEIMAKDYEIIYGKSSGHVENFRRQWKEGFDAGKLRSDRSKINRDIIESLKDDTLATYFTIASLRKYGNTRFGIKVEKGKIRIE